MILVCVQKVISKPWLGGSVGWGIVSCTMGLWAQFPTGNINVCLSICLSIYLSIYQSSISPPLSKINKHILGWGLKKSNKQKRMPWQPRPSRLRFAKLLCGKPRSSRCFPSLKEAVLLLLHRDAVPSLRGLLFHKSTFEQWKTSVMICSFTYQQLSCHSPLQEETCLQKDSP